jgi:hypothetical protein
VLAGMEVTEAAVRAGVHRATGCASLIWPHLEG